ncbi:MAG TPA: hypothetical protein VMI10_18315 [Terriglobales bacterium]|nr:hypothetical protein [Terriglobales bacterium]
MPEKIRQSYKNFDDLREDVARASEGWGSIVRCDRCGQLIAIVYKDFWTDTFNQMTSDSVATCEDCRPNDDED